MSLQKVWNFETEQWDWTDLSYILGKTETPDLRDGKPVEEGKLVSGECRENQEL